MNKVDPFSLSARPPFANYDIVVYFGVGLFSTPFLFRYIVAPLGIPIPSFPDSVSYGFADQIIKFLTFSFFAYIFGHLISYQSAIFIEKFLENTLGKTSKFILLSCRSNAKNRNGLFRKSIKKQLCYNFFQMHFVASYFRVLIHIPVLPWYLLTYAVGMFGFYETRIPKNLIYKIKYNSKIIFGNNFVISRKSSWFRWIEYYVANNDPVANARMYNYLVISGLMRSISWIFLCSIWGEIFLILRKFVLEYPEKSDSLNENYTFLITFFILYISSSTSFAKFLRRYVEEALIAFALSESLQRKE
ncbi:hypothetical protein [Sphingosinicella sp.]|uniref:hypothetical protein n=1 Tax=Sphingosinicella sp. TaxID=1917971 RepID=UPI0017E96B17|nr:hypothetical protein [Sphingosinicella sp.]MBA4757265.1 hypothetical protein [Sphingosinicella sp.]